VDECKPLAEGRGADVSFAVGGETLRAHRFILAARSPVFAAQLDGRAFQGTSNGGRQFLRNRRSNRHIGLLYGKSDPLFTQGRKFAFR